MNAVIRLNNKRLIKKLEDLGYIIWSVDGEDIGLAAGEFNFKAQSFSLPDKIEPCVVGLLDLDDDLEDFVSHGYINCEENEPLFLAVAALRDDSDYMQWFTNGEDWFCSNKIKISDNSWRKATLEELIKYFGV